MYNETTVPSQENLYLSIIGRCKKEVDEIRNKVSIITSPQLCEKSTDTPSRTTLEIELKGLLEKIQELKNDIVV